MPRTRPAIRLLAASAILILAAACKSSTEPTEEREENPEGRLARPGAVAVSPLPATPRLG